MRREERETRNVTDTMSVLSRSRSTFRLDTHVAQPVEPAIVNRAIGGSNPSVGAGRKSAEFRVLSAERVICFILSTQHAELSTDISV